jgi:hypothetical protein
MHDCLRIGAAVSGRRRANMRLSRSWCGLFGQRLRARRSTVGFLRQSNIVLNLIRCVSPANTADRVSFEGPG